MADFTKDEVLALAARYDENASSHRLYAEQAYAHGRKIFWRDKADKAELIATALRALAKSMDAEPVAVDVGVLEATIRGRLEPQFADAYDCIRVWQAWAAGTMSEDDFVPLNDRLDEIMTDVMDPIRSALAEQPAPVAGAGAAVPAIEAARVLILRERLRQIEVEGWTANLDVRHEDGQLLRAAGIYLWHGTDMETPIQKDGTPLSWPWDARWWKPKSRQRNLERAGALCLAEKSRLSRLDAYVGHVEQMLAIVERELATLLAVAPLPASQNGEER